jgi:hypothetical protein
MTHKWDELNRFRDRTKSYNGSPWQDGGRIVIDELGDKTLQNSGTF